MRSSFSPNMSQACLKFIIKFLTGLRNLMNNTVNSVQAQIPLGSTRHERKDKSCRDCVESRGIGALQNSGDAKFLPAAVTVLCWQWWCIWQPRPLRADQVDSWRSCSEPEKRPLRPAATIQRPDMKNPQYGTAITEWVSSSEIKELLLLRLGGPFPTPLFSTTTSHGYQQVQCLTSHHTTVCPTRAILQLSFVAAEGCGCLTESLRFDCGQYGSFGESSRNISGFLQL